MYLKIPRTKIARIQIVKTDRKLSLQQVVAKYKCDAAINGGLYDMHTGRPSLRHRMAIGASPGMLALTSK